MIANPTVFSPLAITENPNGLQRHEEAAVTMPTSKEGASLQKTKKKKHNCSRMEPAQHGTVTVSCFYFLFLQMLETWGVLFILCTGK